ncbi:MAG: sporulation protein [Subdoligranulum variabile]|uniref:Stage III sporulation protein AE n=1 Tax=Qiania dongpingensis TaxID=2763669 RepID=A0A7G9G581_9FIRM|nr:stage III sporulation protein AE [Qiania dongpingensis]PWM60715.1 MAG: sporulation protein [Subdoligranulum variabile]QNM05963.1 stage III sporulation protein AE [Qiania dongpingensis]
MRPRKMLSRMGIVFFLLFWLLFPMSVRAESLEEQADDYDYSGAQEVMDDALEESAPTFSGMVNALVSGKIGETVKKVPVYLKNSLLSEISINRKSLGHVLLIAAFGTIFSGLASSFQDKQAGETGFYVTYLLLLSLLLTAFFEAAEVAKDTVTHVMEFMGALLPAFTLAVAATGKTMTSVFSYEFIMGAVSIVEWLFQVLFLPGIQIYVVLSLVNHISKEEILTKMTELLELVLSWGIKTVIGLVVGYGAIQSMVLPLADSMKTGVVTKALSAIPGIGGGAGAAASLITGTASLIKNGIGAAALIALLLICAVPVLKLAVITILYHGAAAMVQPVADERVTECLSGVASGTRLLLKVTTASAGMFLLTIGILCAFTSVQI